MRRRYRILTLVICIPLLVLLTIFTIVLRQLSEAYPDSSAEVTCRDGICAEIDLAEPIRINHPVGVIIRLQAERDYEHPVAIIMQSSPDNIIFEEPSEWEYTPRIGQSTTLHSYVNFPDYGYYDVVVLVFDRTRGGPVVSNQETVVITSTGAVRNPTVRVNPTQDMSYPPSP